MSSRSDEDLAAAIAASLRASYEAELAARANPPPPRAAAPVPDWLFGPRHRELDAARTAEREKARAAAAAHAQPTEPEPAIQTCPWCKQTMPGDP